MVFGKNIVAAFVLAGVTLVTTMASAQDGNKPFRWNGEELFYSVRVNNVEAVRAGIRVGDVRVMEDGREYVAVTGMAQSLGIFNNFYPIKDKANSYVDPHTYRPLRSEKYFDENGKLKNYKVDYTHSRYKAKVIREREIKGKMKTRKYSRPIPGETHDMFTWFFELRTMGKLAVGQKMSFYVYDGWKLSRLDARVAAKEDVYTPMGWFKAYKIDINREILTPKRKRGKEPTLKVITKKRQSASLWISRDENMIPIKVAIESKFGVGEAIIMKYKLPNRPEEVATVKRKPVALAPKDDAK